MYFIYTAEQYLVPSLPYPHLEVYNGDHDILSCSATDSKPPGLRCVGGSGLVIWRVQHCLRSSDSDGSPQERYPCSAGCALVRTSSGPLSLMLHTDIHRRPPPQPPQPPPRGPAGIQQPANYTTSVPGLPLSHGLRSIVAPRPRAVPATRLGPRLTGLSARQPGRFPPK